MSSFAGDWWDTKGSCKALHDMNQVRVPFVRDGLISDGDSDAWNVDKSTNELKGFKILDVGCGAGVLSEALGMLGAEVIGLDPSEILISTAMEHLDDQKKLNVKYFAELLEDHLETHSGVYDAVVASEVIEHIVDQKSFLKSCVAALKPGGSLFITTINKNWIAWICAIIFGEFILGLLPKNTHVYDQFISPSDVTNILKEFNCRTTQVVGFRYEFFRSVFKFQSNTSVEYGLHAIKQSLKKTE
jgi:polyprenyldihydroxybenzoate methyltransferase/3-demethylubiquinol 3-O-methyltransferase